MKFCMTIFLFLLPVHTLAMEGNLEMIQNRLDRMEQMLEKQNLFIQNQQNVISNQTSMIHELNSDVERLKFNDKSSAVQKRLQSSSNVAFYVELTKPLLNLGAHQHVQFNKVITDTTKFFNPSDGIFIAPVTGMYVFTWSVSARYGSYVKTELVINGTPYGFLDIDSESDSDRANGSQTVVIKVDQGQHVWIRTGTDSGGHLNGNNRDSFSGWVLFSME